ncbi:oxygen-insensitive NADPH nitroreductase [Celerinatantimonas diazotrophica]|uniref:Nitroreductase n=1 Tax=Celerinatantimonas diazotrophica TaxID=412034 RepID=A0A4R1K1E8_9GAMM|nr:oxygen-insensitive NADPH nitroreductase [Celerinatantimonas diazotrophica]TCK57795.1 nitroreductase [Celerinatantimonas diazotrophica]CAG9298141.1 Oxygen-insensitive NADPH nitroreductase [Celerinatantimonas diazotrophica]
MNPTIDLLRHHTSVRKFTDAPISNDQFNTIIESAQMASTSSFLQTGSIVRVSDPQLREKFATLAGGQTWIIEAAEFLVWCVDFHRHQQIAPEAKLGFSEQLLIGAIDVALMAENALVAAESMGLGGVFIGGIRNDPKQVAKLLELPKNVLPLFGMCLGQPNQEPSIRPRLPQPLVVHENSYQQKLDKQLLAEYDQQVVDYYSQRAGSNTKVASWSEQISAILSKESRPHIQAFLNEQGFALK